MSSPTVHVGISIAGPPLQLFPRPLLEPDSIRVVDNYAMTPIMIRCSTSYETPVCISNIGLTLNSTSFMEVTVAHYLPECLIP
jgi:hypothetical protein